MTEDELKQLKYFPRPGFHEVTFDWVTYNSHWKEFYKKLKEEKEETDEQTDAK